MFGPIIGNVIGLRAAPLENLVSSLNAVTTSAWRRTTKPVVGTKPEPGYTLFLTEGCQPLCVPCEIRIVVVGVVVYVIPVGVRDGRSPS